MKNIGAAIDYGIKMNEAEGLYLSEDDRAIFEMARRKEITLDELGEIGNIKYRLLGQGKKITAFEALELYKEQKNVG